ncbi:hypothetical protein HDU67_010062 [Dinochytrium kinnereticum]|nr:hypothetical protein HDU67_010062 [Dinochytrium kinnereticum]
MSGLSKPSPPSQRVQHYPGKEANVPAKVSQASLLEEGAPPQRDRTRSGPPSFQEGANMDKSGQPEVEENILPSSVSPLPEEGLPTTPAVTDGSINGKSPSIAGSPAPISSSSAEPILARRPSKPFISANTASQRYRYSLSGTSSSSSSEFESGDGGTTRANEVAAILSGATTFLLVGSSGAVDDPVLASRKKNHEWHDLFPTVPKDEFLIDEYNCAWQKEVLMQGRMYLSNRRVCFNSNIFGWTQSLNLDFDDIHTINKRSVGGIIPNAIEIVMVSGTNYFFASFIQRDATYEAITKAWGGPSRSIRMRTFRSAAVLEGEEVSINSQEDSTREELPATSTSSIIPPEEAALPERAPSTSSSTLAPVEPLKLPFENMKVELGDPTPPSIAKASMGSATELDVLQPKTYTNRFASALIDEMGKLVVEEGGEGLSSEKITAVGKFPSPVSVSLREGFERERGPTSSEIKSPSRKSSRDYDGSQDLPLNSKDAFFAASGRNTSPSSQSVTLNFPVERRLSGVAMTKGLADLAESIPGSPALSEESSVGGSSGPGSATSHSSLHGLVGASSSPSSIVGMRNQHIVFQKHPVNSSQIKFDGTYRPKSPTVSPDKGMLPHDATLHRPSSGRSPAAMTLSAQSSEDSLASSPSSPMIDLTPHMDNAISRKAASMVATQKPTNDVEGTKDLSADLATKSFSQGLVKPVESGKTEPKKKKKKVRSVAKTPMPNQIPSTSAKCPCDEVHKKMVPIFNGTFKTTVDRLWELLYLTPTPSSPFFSDFITLKRKCQNLLLTDWLNAPDASSTTKSPSNASGSSSDAVLASQCTAGHTSPLSPSPPISASKLDMVNLGSHRHVEYVVPLSNPLGPKSTRCQVRESLEHKEAGQNGPSIGFVCIKQSSITPDVPSGNTFITHLKVCITRVSATEARIKASCDLEFIKSSWIQSVLKVAVPDGMRVYYRELESCLVDYLAAHPLPPPAISREEFSEEFETDEEDEEDISHLAEPKTSDSTIGLEHPLRREVEEIERLEVEEKKRLSPQRGMSPAPPQGTSATASSNTHKLDAPAQGTGVTKIPGDVAPLDSLTSGPEESILGQSPWFLILYSLFAMFGHPAIRTDRFKTSLAVVSDGITRSPLLVLGAILTGLLALAGAFSICSLLISNPRDSRSSFISADMISAIVDKTVRKTLEILDSRSHMDSIAIEELSRTDL